MKRRILACFAALLLCGGTATAAKAPLEPWTIDDVLAMRTVSDPQISPEGQWVAYVVASLTAEQTAWQTDLWLAPVSGGEARRLTTSPVTDESPRWSPDGRTIAFLSDRPRPDGTAGTAAAFDEGRRQVWILRLDGGEPAVISHAPCGVTAFQWSHDGRSIAYFSTEPRSDEVQKAEREKRDAYTPESRLRHDQLWLLEVASGKSRALTPATLQALDCSFSPDDRTLVVATQNRPGLEDLFDSDLSLVPAAGGALKPLVRRPGMDTSPRWSPDGRWIAFTSQQGHDREWYTNNAVCVVSPDGGSPRSLTPGFDECVEALGSGGLTWMPDSRAVVFFAVQRTAQHLIRAQLDGTVGALTAGGGMNRSPSVDATGTTIAYLGEDSEHPCDVWTLPSGGTPRRLTDANPEARGRLAFPKTVVTWKGADGLDIEGLLILPPGVRKGQRVPLVLHVHGGPSDAFGNTCTTASRGFPHALWAQKGWAILLPNPRGSGGYGEAFRAANRRDWGGKDCEDLLRGVDAMVERGIADPTRLVVCGWSYGGFMTATIVTRTDRFRAAVVGAGVTDLGSMVGTSDIPDFDRSYFEAWPWEDPQFYVDHSPLYHAGNVKTPTLILHGEMDDRVPIGQAYELHTALQKRGVPNEMVVFPRSGHAPHEPRLLKIVQERMLEWSDRWTRTTAPAARKPRAGAAGTTRN